METQSTTDSPQPLDDWFLEKLGCSGCEQRYPLHLNAGKDMLICACGRHGFPIGPGGIPNLLIENAVLLDENAGPENVSESAGKTGSTAL